MFIKNGSRKIFIDIGMDSTIHRLKQELEAVEGIPPSEQRIIFSGRQLVDGDKTLSEYGLKTPDQTLLVLRQTNTCRNITLFVRTIQRELDFRLTVALSDKIDRIRGMINERVNLPSSYSLVYKGIVLSDNQTVLDYGLEERSSVYIVTQIVMEVENVNGERVKMKINDNRITGEVVERLVEQRRATKQKKRKASTPSTTAPCSEDDGIPESPQKLSRHADTEHDSSCHDDTPSLDEETTSTSVITNGDTVVEIKDLEIAQSSPRCKKCAKKIGLTGIKCRCAEHFCGAHRYPEEHLCPFDYRTKAKEELTKANPRVASAKVIPIAK